MSLDLVISYIVVLSQILKEKLIVVNILIFILLIFVVAESLLFRVSKNFTAWILT